MITIIIITAVVSVLSTLVLGYFIWSGIGARKLKKEVKDNKNGITSNGEWIKNVEDLLFEKEKEIYNEVKNKFEEITEIIHNLDKNAYDGRDELNNRIDEVYRQIDKRFDNAYRKIEETK